jgi:hypothetical protein
MVVVEAQKQVYDNIIKRCLERHMTDIIPFLLEEKEMAKEEDRKRTVAKVRPLEETTEMNIEALIPPRRNDRVYRAPYKGTMHIVEVEIETSPDSIMEVRSLIYHALLMEKYYGEPIISLILYPFKMPIAYSPLEGRNADGEAVTFHFRVLPLWRFDARTYFAKRVLCMFALLPAMQGVTRDMLLQALDLMVQYYRDQQDENGLREEFLCFGILLRRAAILSPAEIEEVTQKMALYDPFIMEDPHFGGIIKQKAEEAAKEAAKEAWAKGETEGKIEGKSEALAALRNTVLASVEERFPELTGSLKQAAWPESVEEMGLLAMKLATAPDAEAVLHLLNVPQH